jgi:hypothetical protein
VSPRAQAPGVCDGPGALPGPTRRSSTRPGCRSCRSRSRFPSSGPSSPGWLGRRF